MHSARTPLHASQPLAAARRERILALVGERGSARVVDLAAALGVAPMTVRRDIAQLADDGRLDRVHGGVRLVPDAATIERPPSEVERLKADEKAAIARVARSLIRPGFAVGIGAGTTTLALARLLATDAHATPERLTIVTNAMPVAAALDGSDVVLTGGARTASDALVGPIANQAAASLGLDVLFLGAHGMDAARGFTAPNLLEAETNRALIRAARQTVVLADASKWGRLGLASFAALGDVDVIVTDAGIGAGKRLLERRARRLIVARVV